ncbi:hypothetical protein J1605_017567 [Eschrichtius robustus]|uniref:Uncharacterized protein n=1 Tax=Eschrichtius robustus TaxID=9764 RepID=A0AB34I190_ESCRO|nr:hypothetical protein J1605_017567 [Eschrichtius robustus]
MRGERREGSRDFGPLSSRAAARVQGGLSSLGAQTTELSALPADAPPAALPPVGAWPDLGGRGSAEPPRSRNLVPWDWPVQAPRAPEEKQEEEPPQKGEGSVFGRNKPGEGPCGGEQGARRGSGSRVAETDPAPRLWLWGLTRSKSGRRLQLRAELGAPGSGLRPMGNVGLRDSTPDSSPSPPQAQRSQGADDKRRAGEGHRGARPNPGCADTCKEPRNT